MADEDLYDKVELIGQGVSNNIDVAVMIHPCSHNVLEPVVYQR